MISVEPTHLEAIRELRDRYRAEMNCQIIHDSIHRRPGWTHEFLVRVGGRDAGYGSVAVGGPWRETPALYEAYIDPLYRLRTFDLLAALLARSAATHIEVQTNDRLGDVLIHTFAEELSSESILFEDAVTTHHRIAGATFRRAAKEDAPDVSDEERRWRAVITLDGAVAATGGVMFHYNAPFADIYMEVEESYRGRGLGTFMVQELKRLCRGNGFTPAARCRTTNEPSRRTLQKAGFVPCGHILTGRVRQAAPSVPA